MQLSQGTEAQERAALPSRAWRAAHGSHASQRSPISRANCIWLILVIEWGVPRFPCAAARSHDLCFLEGFASHLSHYVWLRACIPWLLCRCGRAGTSPQNPNFNGARPRLLGCHVHVLRLALADQGPASEPAPSPLLGAHEPWRI